MSELNRWSIDELRVRYELEPGLYDLFVEGIFDKDVLSQAPLCANKNIAIYEVDAVEVPVDIVLKHGLSLGNKQRVMALSKELETLPVDSKVYCIVDRDLDHWLNELKKWPRLRWTTFCSIECHFITQQFVAHILITTGQAKIKNAEAFYSSLTKILEKLFALRLSDKELNFCMTWIDLRKYLSRFDESALFDVDKYITALLIKNSKSKDKATFSAAYKKWLKKIEGDVRHASRGHDYTELLAWAMKEFRGQKSFTNQLAIERLLVALAPSISSLEQEFP